MVGNDNDQHDDPAPRAEHVAMAGRATVVGTLFIATFWVSKEPAIALAVTALAVAPTTATVRRSRKPQQPS
ncbi:hypothetical protein ACFT2C_04110 [Promicromonospora sp. NPDC057138]|uniref:hypothetical protein n=1 Tax=Promicromonospora sp. NPDC057138 TaxID=3346031 RepID=UPI00362A02AC